MPNLKNNMLKSMGRVLVVWVFATALLASVTTPAVAAIIEVTSLADNERTGNGFCTLREAILNANADAELSSGDCLAGLGNDAITFSTGPGTIPLSSDLPAVSTEIAIIGPVAGNMVIMSSPEFLVSHFQVDGPGILELDRIDIETSDFDGDNGDLTCVIAASSATLRIYSGYLFCDVGISMSTGSTLVLDSTDILGTYGIEIDADTDTTSITIINSTIRSISGINANASGDAELLIEVRDTTLTGLSEYAGWGMEILANDESTVTTHIVDSIIQDMGRGLIFRAAGSVSALVERTTLSNNKWAGIVISGITSTVFVTLKESTIYRSIVGILYYNSLGHLWVTNSTISTNGDGISNGDDEVNGGFINISHSTVTNNFRGIFGGGSAHTNMDRTILAGNDTDCAGEAPSSTGYNVVGVDCGISRSTADIIGTVGTPVDPGLYSLFDGGGPTRTHGLMVDSPAVDRTSLETCFIGNDQRGVPRPQGNGCDAGSYERDEITPPDITVPGPITQEGTHLGGAIVTYVVTATDNMDPNPDLFCFPTSGTFFPIGTVTIFCTATDFLGNISHADFDVTVQDTTPPSLILVGAAEIEVIESNSYNDPGANAFDIVYGDLTTEIVVTNPADASIPGLYTVSYDVTDNAGNAADTLTRTVTVISQAVAAEDLVETVESLGLPNSVSRSLIQLMTNVAHHLDDDNEANDAADQVLLDRFIIKVQKRLNQGRLTQSQAELLIAKAEELQSALDG
jgi:CSLREA domain-containing protein